jgi:EAL domain-containing protein (putative c-di-GMP-specific phosphodiesterase class I)
MSGCAHCQHTPEVAEQSGTLYIAPPVEHVSGKVRQLLKQVSIEYAQPHEGIIEASLEDDALKMLAELVPEQLSAVELQDCKALFVVGGETPGIMRLMQAEPLGALLAKARGEWLLEMLRESRLTTVFQPIVNCSRPESVFGYECLLRGKDSDGRMVSPGKIIDVARAANLLFNLDSAARRAAIRSASTHAIAGHVFVNFLPTSIYDPRHCLRTTLREIQDTELSPERIVFEVVESEEVADVDHLLDIVSFYRENGFCFALDDLGSGYSSMNLLAKLQPDFVKLDMGLIRNIHQEPYKAHIAAKLIELARALEVRTIAEGVETEGEWSWLETQGVDYVQGYLFAAPGTPPPIPRSPYEA